MRIDKILQEFKKPDLLPIEDIGLHAEDTLILCAGFEDRAMEVLNRAIKKSKAKFSVQLIKYLPEYPENKLDKIRKVSKKAGLHVNEIPYDRKHPEGVGDSLLKGIPKSKGMIFIDISAMSRLMIVQLIVSFHSVYGSFDRINILYSEAKAYPPTKAKAEKKLQDHEMGSAESITLLSSGVFEVAIVPELSTVAMQGAPIRLIMFPSFNEHQLLALRSEIQPSFYTIVHGMPPYKSLAWRIDAINRLNEIDDIQNSEKKTISTMDYRETFDLLLEQYDKHGEMQKIVIAPTGSKMQAVAIGLFRAYMSDVQIVYPTPRDLDAGEYTKGVKNIYMLSLSSFQPAIA